MILNNNNPISSDGLITFTKAKYMAGFNHGRRVKVGSGRRLSPADAVSGRSVEYMAGYAEGQKSAAGDERSVSVEIEEGWKAFLGANGGRAFVTPRLIGVADFDNGAPMRLATE